MGSAFDHNPTITVPGSSTNTGIVTWSGTGGKTFLDSTVLVVGNNITIPGTITFGGVAITSTAAELNILDGVTSTAAELNLLDGVSGLVQSDLTKLAAIDSTAAEINLLDALDRGSILYGNNSGVTTVLGQGGADTVLTSDGTDISWAAAAGGGKILQAQTAIFSGIQTITTDDNSFTDITSLTVNITPAANTSKILILVCIGKHDTNSDANTTQFIVYRGSHRLNTGNGAASTDTTISNRIAASFTSGVTGQSNGNGNQHFSCLDSPATASQITYVVAASCHDQDVYINRWRTDSDNTDGPSARTASSITVLEVGA